MTYVYFVTDGDFIKIGIAKDVKKRLQTLQTGNPKRLKVLKTIALQDDEARMQEENYHRKFRDYNACGEWFKMCDELCVAIGLPNLIKDRERAIESCEKYLGWLKEQTETNTTQLMRTHELVLEEQKQLKIAQENLSAVEGKLFAAEGKYKKICENVHTAEKPTRTVRSFVKHVVLGEPIAV